MKQTSAMVTGHVAFGGTDDGVRLNDCPRGGRRGRSTCAECFLQASLDALAPVRPSLCARRQFMQLVVAPTLWEAGLGAEGWFDAEDGVPGDVSLRQGDDW